MSLFKMLRTLGTGLTVAAALASQAHGMEAEHLAAVDGKTWVLSTYGEGLHLLSAEGNTLHRVAGNFDQSSYLALSTGKGLLAAINRSKNSVDLFELADTQLKPVASYPEDVAQVTGICLFHDAQSGLVQGVVLRDEQSSVQRIFYDTRNAKPVLRDVRHLPGGANITGCQVALHTDQLAFSEEGFGLWSMAANPERESARTMLLSYDDSSAFGNEPAATWVINRTAIAVAGDSEVYIYASGNTLTARYPVQSDADATAMYYDTASNKLTWAAFNAEQGLVHGDIALALQEPLQKPSFVAVQPEVETQPMRQFGDAADDPAIWINPNDAEASLILGTDKTRGLASYTLDGELHQFVEAGRLNNVDLRTFQTPDGRIDTLVVASHRDHNAISLFSLDTATRNLSAAGEIATGLSDVYGICAGYRADTGQFAALINSKDGRYEVYALNTQTARPEGHLIASFQLPDQPEGCVVDDATHRVFVGVEDRGVWLWDWSKPTQQPKQILSVGGPLQDDVEGLALYQGHGHALLVVSSQGNDSYALYNSAPPFDYRGTFQVTTHLQAGIDGASETDGLAITSQPMGERFPKGVLVVQDGRNVMPVEPQNFKLISVDTVLKALNLTP